MVDLSMALRIILLKFLSKILLAVTVFLTVYTVHSQFVTDNNYNINFHNKTNNSKYIGSNFDLKYVRFNININPDTIYVEGVVTSYFEYLQSADTVNFELSNFLVVDSVICSNQKCIFIHNNDVINIKIPHIINIGNIDSVSIFYKGSPVQGSGFGSFVKDYHNGIPIIWTLSQPYGSKNWWPCKNNLSDKIDSVDIIVKTPYPHRTASNGLLIDEITSQGYTVAHWKHKYPITPYLIAIAVTNYVDYSDYVYFDDDTLEILNYVFPEDIFDIQSQSAGIIPIFKLFDSLFIPYPFANERYGHAQFLWGGGMEHQTMTFITDFNHHLMSHELAHSWFGNYITCGSWQDVWLNEGFATYITGLSYEFLFNGFWWNSWKSFTLQNVLSQPDGSVFCYDTTDFSRVFDSRLSYNKAALVLHSLRWLVGDSAFFVGVYNYLTDNNFAYSFAFSNDFISKIETAADTSLTEFFSDWLYGEGYPVYDINCDIISETHIKFSINQSTSHNSIDLFEMPLPVRFKNFYNDTIIIFNNNQNYQEWSVNLGFIPDSVIFDPDMWIIAKLNSLNLNINDNFVNNNNELNVFPNPASDILNIYLNYHKINYVSLINAVGQEFFVDCIVNIDNEYCQLDIKSLKTGFYVLKIYSGYDVFYKKFIKNL